MGTIVSNEVQTTPEAGVVLTSTKGNNRVDLSWNALPGATAQRVYRRSGIGAYAQVGTVPVGTTTFADIKGMNPGTSAGDPSNGTAYFHKVEVDVP
jgi:hypothetical protein